MNRQERKRARPAPSRLRAATTLGFSALVGVGTLLAAGAGPAAGQESPPSSAPPSSAASSTTSTSTTAPPMTVVLDDGDFGVVPPGADPAPGDPPPEDGEAPPPADGELELPEELAVIVLPDPTPGLNAALAAIDVSKAERALAEVQPARRGAEMLAAAAAIARTDATEARRAAGDHLAGVRALIEAMAVNVVIYGDVAAIEPPLLPTTLEHLRDRELGDAVADDLVARLEAAEAAHAAALDAESEAIRALVEAQEAERFAFGIELLKRVELAEAIRTAEEARKQRGPAILGPTVLELEDLVAWYRTFYAADPPVAPIEDIIETYLRIGEEEGVTGDIAFAQAILETGGFRSGHAQGFNFAGIGAYDHCAPTCGFRFPDLDQGVRAHIHLLRAYADPGLTTAQLAARPNAQVAPERVGVRGCCERWTALTGVWATDPNYDRKVLGIYRLMVEQARARQRALL